MIGTNTSPNDQAQQPAHAGLTLKSGKPFVAWPVCCSKLFGLATGE
jgi:hypothetical protein